MTVSECQVKHPRIDDAILKYSDLTPNNTAIRFENGVVTFADLYKRVNALAFYLYTTGVGPGKFVTVLLDPSEDVVVAMLAIFRVGAIYTPLDPLHPDSQIVDRAQEILPSITITQSRHRERVEALDLPSVFVDEMKDVEVPGVWRLDSQQSDPACVFFTSGSTGKAKGVLGSYEALSAAIIEPSEYLGVSSSDTLNSIARYAWSISMLELLGALVQGGSTLILDRQKALDLDWLSNMAGECTAFHCPPALLKNLAEYIDREKKYEIFFRVKLVWYGGDVFDYAAIDLLQKVFPNARVATAYGTTEIFGLSHCYFYPRQNDLKKVLIGKPVGSIKQKILDEKGAEISVDDVGEIYMGGPRVALEYYGNPMATKNKFVFLNGERYFATGDFARLDQDGNLEYLQRTDDQVKVRGIRVSLGEVNDYIKEYVTVKESVVLTKENSAGTNEIHAFIVFWPSAGGRVSDLRKYLYSVLPDYMVPATLTELDTFPYTENFKINRKALISEVLQKSNSVIAHFSHPASIIAGLWVQAGNVVASSERDNFFEVGGNSISAIALASLMSSELGVRVQVADIYRNPSLELQVELVSKENTLQGKPSHEEEVRGSFAQVGLFFREIFDKRDSSITCTRYIIRDEGFDDDLVRKSLAALMERYKTLRTTIKPSKGSLKLSLTETPSTEEVLLERVAGVWCVSEDAGANRIVKRDYKFNLANGPLLAAFCFRLDSGAELMQLSAHHIAADDNSTGRIAKDFVKIYDALSRSSGLELSPIKNEYSEFLEDQRKRFEAGLYDGRAKIIGERLIEHLSNSTADPLISAVENGAGVVSVSFRLSDKKNCAVTFVDVVASMSWALHGNFSRNKFVFCVHVALRKDTDQDPQVGMFVNLVPVFISVSPDLAYCAHVKQVRQAFEEAMSDSDVPYELIIRSQEDLRRLGRFPFDGFINELRFDDEYLPGYKSVVIPRTLSTDTGEISLSVIRSNSGVELKLESPSFQKGKEVLSKVITEIAEKLPAQAADA
ncbi:AMP-binding protein [Microbulbifer sp. SA54]|uniref:AMP-binding protein n=1 Tax=Microbulbifer sp. SA54 TaxID=3401577 RepID=UPI003AB0FE50